jgi:putative ABC transport system permease protein
VLILKNLLRRRTRSILSLAGVAIGVAAIVAFNAIGQGFKASLNQYMAETGAQCLIVNRTVQDPAFSRVNGEEIGFIRSQAIVTHVSLATFSLASPRALKMRTGGMPAMPVFGRTPGDRLLDKFRGRVRGRILESDDELMLGPIAAENLGLDVGDSIEMFQRTFKVVGIHDSGVSFERIGAIASNAVIQKQLGLGDSANILFVYIAPDADWTALKRTVEERYPHLSAIRSDEFMVFYDQLEYIDWFVWVVSLVSVVVGGLGVLNTMLMSVSERTREIGTLRAVGWSRVRVLRMILAEGLSISLAGGLAGLATGWAGAEVLIRWAPRGFLSTRYSLELFAVATLVAIGLGFAGALYPAWQASRLSPIEALKYE